MRQTILFKKLFFGFLILLLSVRLVVPSIVLADDSTDTPTPTITDTPTPTDSVTPTDTPTPTPDVTLTATDSAGTTNAVTNTGTSGDNSITATDSATPTPDETTADATESSTPQTTITTGDSTSNTQTVNDSNTTTVNSDLVYQTVNIYLDQNGNIDLSAPISVAEQIASQSDASDSANILMTSSTNYAEVNNIVDTSANSGNNTSSTPGQTVITTGNAYSLVQLLNKVNVTLVDSAIHIITVNIYGNVTGNVLLPDLGGNSTCSSCSMAVTVNNSASVTNTVNNSSNTGDNSITTTGGTNSIQTGNATSVVNIENFINMIILGQSFEHVYINTFGTWDGSFLGWDGLTAQQGGTNLDEGNVPVTNATIAPSESTDTTVANTADVTNTINNSANTGNNTTTTGNATITTGNAYAFVSLVNLVNSLFVKSTGFLGFINIFGSLHGDIGGATQFITPTPTPSLDTSTPEATTQKQDGGQLSVENSNNVGAYVNPGDTVTLFANVKNTGTGEVYGANLHVALIHNGQESPVGDFALGDTPAGHGYKINTGLVLSQKADPGLYTIRITATGTTGENNTTVSASADSTFTIAGAGFNNPNTNGQQVLPTILQGNTKHILGAATAKTGNSDTSLYFALLGILLVYLFVRVLRAREQLTLLFTPGANFKARLNMLRLFLL